MTADNAIHYALLLFDRGQWQILIAVLVAIVALTEQIKRIFLIGMPVAKKRRYVYATSSALSLLVVGVGYMVVGHRAPVWFWLFTAATGGPVSNWCQKMAIGVIAWKWPGLAERLEGKKK